MGNKEMVDSVMFLVIVIGEQKVIVDHQFWWTDGAARAQAGPRPIYLLSDMFTSLPPRAAPLDASYCIARVPRSQIN